MLPKFHNPLISLGFQVVLGRIPLVEAIRQVRQSPELISMPDEQLLSVTTEAKLNTAERLETEVGIDNPNSLLPYPELMLACVEERLKAISSLRKAAGPEEKAVLSERMARWLTVLANCQLLKAKLLLVQPDPRAAYETFLLAEFQARTLPDSGVLRWQEVMCACFGRQVCGLLLRDSKICLESQETINHMLQGEKQQEAYGYLDELRNDFQGLENILRKRQAQLSKAVPGEKDLSDFSYSVTYLQKLGELSDLIQAGRVSLEEAKQQLLWETDLSLLRDIDIYLISMNHRQMAESSPDTTAVAAELNYAVAERLSGERGELTRAYCAFALGLALMEKARVAGGELIGGHHAYRIDRESYQQAIAYLEEALITLESKASIRGDVASIYTRLAICYRGLDEFARAMQWSKQAIALWEALLKQVDPKSLYLSNLGVAYGNLADIQEQLGQWNEAIRGHHHAFQLFLDARDLLRARQALYVLLERYVGRGRFDDAIAVCQKMSTLLLEVGDPIAAVNNYLEVARLGVRVDPQAASLELLDKAKQLLTPLLERGAQQQELLSLQVDLLLQRANALTILLRIEPSEALRSKARQTLTEARAVAQRTGNAELLAATLVQMAIFHEVAGEFEEVESCYHQVEQLPCSDFSRQRGAGILGNVRLAQGRDEEALQLLMSALAAYRHDHLNKALEMFRIGNAYLGLHDVANAAKAFESAIDIFEASREELYEESRIRTMEVVTPIYNHLVLLYSLQGTAIYNPQHALMCLERVKSRTFIEALGLSSPPLHGVTKAVKPLLDSEHQLLAQLRAQRLRLALTAEYDPVRFDLQQQAQDWLAQLAVIWKKIAADSPEYIEFRKGLPVEWSDLQQMLALN